MTYEGCYYYDYDCAEKWQLVLQSVVLIWWWRWLKPYCSYYSIQWNDLTYYWYYCGNIETLKKVLVNDNIIMTEGVVVASDITMYLVNLQ